MGKVLTIVRNNGKQPPEGKPFFCRLGIHRWRHKKSFFTNIVNNLTDGEIINHQESYRGYECNNCKDRKLKEKHVGAPGIIIEAIAWRDESVK